MPGPTIANLENAVAAVIGDQHLALSKFVGSTDTDNQHLSGLAPLSAADGGVKKGYMAAVAPWFFTHFGADSFNKNVSSTVYESSDVCARCLNALLQFIFLDDQHLYAKRWDSLIAQRDLFDIVEIVTWNNYGESHYAGPIKGDQPPQSRVWTNGMDHTG